MSFLSLPMPVFCLAVLVFILGSLPFFSSNLETGQLIWYPWCFSLWRTKCAFVLVICGAQVDLSSPKARSLRGDKAVPRTSLGRWRSSLRGQPLKKAGECGAVPSSVAAWRPVVHSTFFVLEGFRRFPLNSSNQKRMPIPCFSNGHWASEAGC